MQHIASVMSSREASRYVDVDASTIQRAIGRGELPASRPREHAPYRIQRADLVKWAADNGYAMLNGSGDRIDASTGEVLDGTAPASDVPERQSARVAEARARLAGVDLDVKSPADCAYEVSNVARVLLPSADAGLLEACRRLAVLPESPELWQALRAVLGVGA